MGRLTAGFFEPYKADDGDGYSGEGCNRVNGLQGSVASRQKRDYSYEWNEKDDAA